MFLLRVLVVGRVKRAGRREGVGHSTQPTQALTAHAGELQARRLDQHPPTPLRGTWHVPLLAPRMQAGPSPLALPPKAEDSTRANTNPMAFLLRVLLGTAAGFYYVSVCE